MKSLSVLGLALCLGGCLSTSLAPRGSAEASYSIAVAGNHQAVADCAYGRLRGSGYAVDKIDLPSQGLSQIVWQSDAYRIWEINLRTGAAGTTQIDFHMAPSLRGGSEPYRTDLEPHFRACAA